MTFLVVTAVLTLLFGLVFYWSAANVIKAASSKQKGARVDEFWAGLIAQVVVTVLIPGGAALLFGGLFLRTLYFLVTGQDEGAPADTGH